MGFCAEVCACNAMWCHSHTLRIGVEHACCLTIQLMRRLTLGSRVVLMWFRNCVWLCCL